MADEKTVNPQLAYLNLATDSLAQGTFTSFTTIIDEFLDEVDNAYDHHLTKVESDPIVSEAIFFSNLQSTGRGTSLPEFLLFWIDKYHTAHAAVKAELNSILGDSNEFFKPFSESMGHLKYVDFIKDRSTQPIFDTDSAILDISCQYAGVTDAILDPQTKIITQYLSKLTTSVFKQNIKELGEPQKMEDTGKTTQQLVYSKPTKAHGINLVVDELHYKRMKGTAVDIVKILKDDLKGLYSAFNFIETHTSNQTVLPQTIQKQIEDLQIKVDFIGHSIIDSTIASSTASSDVLSVGGKTPTIKTDGSIEDTNTTAVIEDTKTIQTSKDDKVIQASNNEEQLSKKIENCYNQKTHMTSVPFSQISRYKTEADIPSVPKDAYVEAHQVYSREHRELKIKFFDKKITNEEHSRLQRQASDKLTNFQKTNIYYAWEQLEVCRKNFKRYTPN